MEAYKTGELQLIYDLAREFPTRITVEPNPKDPKVLKLTISDANLANFVDFLLRQMRLARNYLETTCVDSQPHFGHQPAHPELVEDSPEGG